MFRRRAHRGRLSVASRGPESRPFSVTKRASSRCICRMSSPVTRKRSRHASTPDCTRWFDHPGCRVRRVPEQRQVDTIRMEERRGHQEGPALLREPVPRAFEARSCLVSQRGLRQWRASRVRGGEQAPRGGQELDRKPPARAHQAGHVLVHVEAGRHCLDELARFAIVEREHAQGMPASVPRRCVRGHDHVARHAGKRQPGVRPLWAQDVVVDQQRGNRAERDESGDALVFHARIVGRRATEKTAHRDEIDRRPPGGGVDGERPAWVVALPVPRELASQLGFSDSGRAEQGQELRRSPAIKQPRHLLEQIPPSHEGFVSSGLDVAPKEGGTGRTRRAMFRSIPSAESAPTRAGRRSSRSPPPSRPWSVASSADPPGPRWPERFGTRVSSTERRRRRGRARSTSEPEARARSPCEPSRRARRGGALRPPIAGSATVARRAPGRRRPARPRA